MNSLARGDLVEPFGPAGRIASHCAYWLITSNESGSRPEVTQFCDWVEARAGLTRVALGGGGGEARAVVALSCCSFFLELERSLSLRESAPGVGPAAE